MLDLDFTLIFHTRCESKTLESGISNFCANSLKIHKNFWKEDTLGQKVKKVSQKFLFQKDIYNPNSVPLFNREIGKSEMVEIPAEYLPFHNAELVVGIFSLLANGTLLYLILYKTPKELLEYRPFVFMVTVSTVLPCRSFSFGFIYSSLSIYCLMCMWYF